MRTATHRSVGQTLTDDEGREFELPIADTLGDPSWNAIVSDLPDGRVLVSYLVVDDDAGHQDPSKEDCSGWQVFKVLWSQRDADELSAMFECESCGNGYRDHLDDDGQMRTDLDTWLNCDGWQQPPAAKAVDEGRAFLFERYEHGLVNYGLRGESSQVDRQWDVTAVAGFMWADDDWGADVDIKEMARSFLETYTAWCNGEVYGIVHAHYTDQHGTGWEQDGDEEACWGFIGHEFAETEMKSEHEHTINT